MQATLDIALIQSDLLWEDPEGNREMFEGKLEESLLKEIEKTKEKK